MSRLIFQELLVFSRKERAARRLKLHPRWNVLSGPNGAGKSSLTKTLVWTFGTEPPVTDEWKAADVTAMVKFRVGPKNAAVMRRGKELSLFVDDELVGVFRTKAVQAFTQPFSDLVSFGLILGDRGSEVGVTPPPAFYFIPFYVDQDVGWSSDWKSFQRMEQFSRWQSPVERYHLGIYPNRWYEVRAEIRTLRTEIQSPKARLRILRELIAEIERLLEALPVDLDLDTFQESVSRLKRQIRELHEAQRRALQELREVETLRARLIGQQQIVKRALAEITSDLDFTADVLPDVVDCPTCGAEYANNSTERFGLARDEQFIVALLADISHEKRVLDADIAVRKNAADAVAEEMKEVQSTLETKIGDVSLEQIARSKGKEELLRVSKAKREEIAKELGSLIDSLKNLEHEKKEIEAENRKRSKAIIADYIQRTARNARALGLPQWAAGISSPPRTKGLGGSERPRAVLARTLAFVSIAHQRGSCATPPLVLDSPKQQDPSPENWRKVLDLVATGYDRGSQLLFTTRENAERLQADRQIQLSGTHGGLLPDQYDLVVSEMSRYLRLIS